MLSEDYDAISNFLKHEYYLIKTVQYNIQGIIWSNWVIIPSLLEFL